MGLFGRRSEAGGSGPIQFARGGDPVGVRHGPRRTAAGLLALSLGLSVPAEAGFFDRLQHLCDADFPGCATLVPNIDGVYAVALSPDGKHLYACAALDDSLTAFTRNATTGALRRSAPTASSRSSATRSGARWRRSPAAP